MSVKLIISFHIHSFIKQTRLSQPDFDNCGAARSVAFISFEHMAVLSLILAIPKGGVLKALCRGFWEYPVQILTAPAEWFEEILKFF